MKLVHDGEQTRVFDPVRRKYIVLTPEEHVRQSILQYMVHQLQYPLALIAVEKAIQVNGRNKRFDIVVYNKQHKPWLLVECKAPEIEVTEHTLFQLLQYHNTLQSSFWVLTNGVRLLCADARDVTDIRWLPSFPVYGL